MKSEIQTSKKVSTAKKMFEVIDIQTKPEYEFSNEGFFATKEGAVKKALSIIKKRDPKSNMEDARRYLTEVGQWVQPVMLKGHSYWYAIIEVKLPKA